METQDLVDLGLTKTEAKIYLTLLELGISTAGKISEKSKVYRRNVYDSLATLIAKGLVSYVIKENIKYFKTAHPSKLLSYLNEKQDKAKAIIPDLLKLESKEKEDTTVEIFKGIEGLKTVFKDIIRAGEDYIALGEEGEAQKILPFFAKKFLKEIEKSNIKEKVIAREDYKGKIIESKNSEVKYLPKEYVSPTSLVIYGNKVANFIWSKPHHVILTTNKEVADSYRSYFKLLWQMAKK